MDVPCKQGRLKLEPPQLPGKPTSDEVTGETRTDRHPSGLTSAETNPALLEPQRPKLLCSSPASATYPGVLRGCDRLPQRTHSSKKGRTCVWRQGRGCDTRVPCLHPGQGSRAVFSSCSLSRKPLWSEQSSGACGPRGDPRRGLLQGCGFQALRTFCSFP